MMQSPFNTLRLPGPFARRRGRGAAFGPAATGGVETVIEQSGKFYRVHTFLESGNLDVTQGGEVEYLVVAGGGGGAGTLQFNRAGGGGGGSGGALKYIDGEDNNTGSKLNLLATSHAITVGEGGAPTLRGDDSTTADNGGNSVAFGLEAIGGGGGGNPGSVSGVSGADGGSGGGAGSSEFDADTEGGISIQPGPGLGTDGGAVNSEEGAGGGGALTPGQTSASDGVGGEGLISAISGDATGYAGGGGGGRQDTATSSTWGGGTGAGVSEVEGSPGVSGTGGGGGGGNAGNGGGLGGYAGGSGIVIVRYQITEEEYDAEAV